MASVITKSVADKPLQWFGIIAGLGVGYYLIKKSVKTGRQESIVEGAETDVSENNPFSYSKFLSQTIPAGTPLLRVATAQSNARQIYDSLNTYFSDDEDIVIGVFSSLSSKVKIAQVCQQFQYMYKKDILEYLKNGNKTFDFGTGGLSAEDYNRILNIVNNKPKF
jgi:hypothetical protein